MDKRSREEIRFLVSEARTRVVETQDAKRVGARLRRGKRPEPHLPTIEVSRYTPRRSQIVSSVGYRYELRGGDELVRTGHITRMHALEVGERIVIAAMNGIVRTIEPVPGAGELQLAVQLLREGIGL